MSDSMTALRYDANKKSLGVAYLLLFFLGGFGAHRFYLGKNGSAAAILIITVVSWLLMLVFIGFITIFISAIWVFIDMFTLPAMIREWNNRLVDTLAPQAAVTA